MRTTRLNAIDQFRGFAILLMVLADYLVGVNTVPAALKHAPDIGYTIVDLIAPLFVFAIGLTYGLSFRRRAARDGYWLTYQHFVTRYLALIGLGFLLTLGGDLTGLYESSINWGLLQALGAAGLLTLLVIRLPAGWRAAAGLGMLAVYQLLLDRFWLDAVVAAPHNGPWGALSWGALLILATVMADLYHGAAIPDGDVERGRRLYLWATLTAIVIGLALAAVVPLSKHRASASYVMLSLGLSAGIFYLFHLLNARTSLQLPILDAWGRNALLLYVLHGVVIALFALPPAPGWYEEAPLWLVALQATALLAILSGIGLYLDRRKLYWQL